MNKNINRLLVSYKNKKLINFIQFLSSGMRAVLIVLLIVLGSAACSRVEQIASGQEKREKPTILSNISQAFKHFFQKISSTFNHNLKKDGEKVKKEEDKNENRNENKNATKREEEKDGGKSAKAVDEKQRKNQQIELDQNETGNCISKIIKIGMKKLVQQTPLSKSLQPSVVTRMQKIGEIQFILQLNDYNFTQKIVGKCIKGEVTISNLTEGQNNMRDIKNSTVVSYVSPSIVVPPILNSQIANQLISSLVGIVSNHTNSVLPTPIQPVDTTIDGNIAQLTP